jgi:hypothetical protein
VHACSRQRFQADGGLIRKVFVRGDGSTVVQKQGALSNPEVRKIQGFIREHYLEMYELWKTDSDKGFYEN